MQSQIRTIACKAVAITTLLAVLAPSAWLVSMTLPNARATLSAAPERYDLHPVAFWASLMASAAVSTALIAALTCLAIASLLGRTSTDRPLFLALNAIWVYIGVIAILGKVPGLALLFRTTFAASNFGWFLVIATGLPIWGPLILWFFGTARPCFHDPMHDDG
jgi:hypothetical protein